MTIPITICIVERSIPFGRGGMVYACYKGCMRVLFIGGTGRDQHGVLPALAAARGIDLTLATRGRHPARICPRG